MHNFSDLAYRCSVFTTNSLNEVELRTNEALDESGATSLVKTLQMIRLNKIIFAVGLFSIFESILQESLNCKNGFVETKKILAKAGETELLSKFTDIEQAINALKHGRGGSYNALIEKKGGTLESRIKQPTEDYFDINDISEVVTLIDVDDTFIFRCVDIIEQVSERIKREKPDLLL